MIVDDDKDFLEEFRETLVLSGYEIEAVTEPAAHKFQLADELRKAPGLARVPIIAMSAYFKDEYVALMNLCGISTCLKKPFNALDIISHIEEALRRGGMNGSERPVSNS